MGMPGPADEVTELLQRAMEAHMAVQRAHEQVRAHGAELQRAHEQLARALVSSSGRPSASSAPAAARGVPELAEVEPQSGQQVVADHPRREHTLHLPKDEPPESASPDMEELPECYAIPSESSGETRDDAVRHVVGISGAGDESDALAPFGFRDQWNKRAPLMSANTGPFAMQGWRSSLRWTRRACSLSSQSILDESTDCTIRPDSTKRLCWDIVGLCLIFYDFVTIPFVISFHISDDNLIDTMDWVTLLFWTADMVQGFFLAYFDKGVLVTSHAKVLRNYMRGWCLIDILVVLPGWIVKFSDAWSSGQPVGLFGKVLKALRAIRIMRLARLAKLQRILHSFYDHIEDERKFILIHLVKLLLLVSVMNHVIACAWFFIGSETEQFGTSWTREHLSIDRHTMLDKYLISLHWSLTQFTPASMSVSATNEVERAFSIVVLFVAMVCFSSIVGSISGSMTTLRSMSNEVTRDFWLLRKYLKQRNINQDLRRRVCKFLEFQVMGKPRRVDRGQLTLLDKLSADLSDELRHADHWPVVEKHPCFQLLQGEENARCHQLCGLCFSEIIFAESEVVFRFGDEGRFMYFLKQDETFGLKGSCMDFRHGLDGEKEPIFEGAWISEAVLWTDWRHLGELKCNHTCDLMTVDPNQFAAAVRHHPRPWFLAREYGYLFLHWLNSLEGDDVSDLLCDDLFRSHFKGAIETGNVFSDNCGSVSEFTTALKATSWHRAQRDHGEAMRSFSPKLWSM